MASIYVEFVSHVLLRQATPETQVMESLTQPSGNIAGRSPILCCRLWSTLSAMADKHEESRRMRGRIPLAVIFLTVTAAAKQKTEAEFDTVFTVIAVSAGNSNADRYCP
jgi:hypothetical protein